MTELSDNYIATPLLEQVYCTVLSGIIDVICV